MEPRFTVTLALDAGYQFTANVDTPLVPAFRVDEAPPLGEGHGPNPARLLGTAVGHCLASSLLFCLRKAQIPVEALSVRVSGALGRNDAGRFRVEGLSVELDLDIDPAHRTRASRCLSIFEDYCIVTESVRAGVPVEVTVATTADTAAP